MANSVLCPGCGKAVEDGVNMRGQLWHHECAARLISEEAEAAVEAATTKAEKPPSRAWSCGVLTFQISLLVIVCPLLGLIVGGLVGAAGGYILANWLNYEIKLFTQFELSWLPWVLAVIGALIAAIPGAQQGFIAALEFLSTWSNDPPARPGKPQKKR